MSVHVAGITPLIPSNSLLDGEKSQLQAPVNLHPGKESLVEWNGGENKQVQRRRSLNAAGEEEGEAAELGRRQKHKTTRNRTGRWKRKKEDTTMEK